MAGPAGRSPDEEALLQKAMRVLPGGVLGGYYAPQELAFVVREVRGPRLYDFSGREPSRPWGTKITIAVKMIPTGIS